jgi:hypothetical protein
MVTEVSKVTKATVTRTWIAGLIGFAAGLVLVGVSVGLMLAYGGHFTPAASGNGYDFVPSFDAFFATTVTFTVIAAVVAIAGGVIQLVAWVGALINTNHLVDKTWFVVLLIGGLVGFMFAPIGFAAMVAYVVAGPDGTAVQQPLVPSPTVTSATPGMSPA